MSSELPTFDTIMNEKGETFVNINCKLEGRVKDELYDSDEHDEPKEENNFPHSLEGVREVEDNQCQVVKEVKEEFNLEQIKDECKGVLLSDLHTLKFKKENIEEMKDNFSTSKTCLKNPANESIIRYNYFDKTKKEKNSSDDDESDEDDEENGAGGFDREAINSCAFINFPTWTSNEANNKIDDPEISEDKNGPCDQLVHVREQIKSTRDEIAKLEKMMSRISDLRQTLENRDSLPDLKQLAQISIQDFQEFETYLMEETNSVDQKKDGVPNSTHNKFI